MTPHERQELLSKKLGELLEILGVELPGTAKRIAKMYVQEAFCGLYKNPPEPQFQVLTGSSEQIIHVKRIQVTSFCEHHFVPMMGYADVSYQPAQDHIVGLSFIHHLVDYYAKRPQLQERLTRDIAEGLQKALKTKDVAVTLVLRHFCVQARGVEDRATETKTEVLKGCFTRTT